MFVKFFYFMIALAPLALNCAEPKQVSLPAKGLQELMEGNERYINDKLEHPNRTTERREALVSTQTPFATVVGCSDSRVSPEIVFDQGIGDIFVVRVAGNVIGPIGLASILYSVTQLGSSLVVILGHENCGAVKAVLNKQTQGIEPIAAKIQTALTPAIKTLEQAVKANVRTVAQQLKTNEIIAKLIAEKKLAVVGGYYHLASGKVELCCD